MTATLVESDVCREPAAPAVDLATVRAFERGEIRLYSTRPHHPRPVYPVPCPHPDCPTGSTLLVGSEAEFEARLLWHLDEVDHSPR